MPRTVTVIDTGVRDERLDAAAAALGRLLGLGTDRAPLPEAHATADVKRWTEELVAGGTRLLALGPTEPGSFWRSVAAASVCPVLAVPSTCRRPGGTIERILLPLDGSVQVAASLADFARLAAVGGAEVRALHVFGPGTVPAFWNPAHSRSLWSREFADRNLPDLATVDLRRGNPEEQTLRAAEAMHADLIALGWAQEPARGRARLVRQALERSRVPVLLISTRGPGLRAEDLRDDAQGPSPLPRPAPSAAR